MGRALLGALLVALYFVGPAQAQTPPFGGTVTGGTSYTVTTASSVLVLGDRTRTAVVLDNPSASINVACAFSGTAALNTGGSFMVPAGAVRYWPAIPGGAVPTGPINCIAASGSPTITIFVAP